MSNDERRPEIEIVDDDCRAAIIQPSDRPYEFLRFTLREAIAIASGEILLFYQAERERERERESFHLWSHRRRERFLLLPLHVNRIAFTSATSLFPCSCLLVCP